jgi:glycine hydroxymethyltransferase
LTGIIAQKCLEECGIVVDRVELPYESGESMVCSGIRLGTAIVTKNGMGDKEIASISTMIDAVLKEVKIISERECRIEKSFRDEMRGRVKQLCSRFAMR